MTRNYDHLPSYDADGNLRHVATADPHVSEVTLSELFNELGQVGRGALQAAWDGMVVPVYNGSSPSDAIDVATATPVQDAVDDIKANADTDAGEPQGAVLLPPGLSSVNEKGTVVDFSGIAFHGLGGGVQGSTITFKDNGDSDAFEFDGIKWAEFRNVRIRGGGVGNRTGGSAFHFVNNNSRNITVDNVEVRGWDGSDPWVHMDSAAMYASTWGLFEVRDSDADAEVFGWNDTQGGPDNFFRTLRFKPNSTDPTPFRHNGGGETVIGNLNCSGSAESFGNLQGGSGVVRILSCHWEGATTGNRSTLWFVADTGQLEIGPARVNGGTWDSFVEQASGGNNTIWQATEVGGASITDQIDVSGDDSETSVYMGDSADVNNSSGGTLSNGWSCLGDLSRVT